MQITTKIDIPHNEVVDAIKMYLLGQGVGGMERMMASVLSISKMVVLS